MASPSIGPSPGPPSGQPSPPTAFANFSSVIDEWERSLTELQHFQSRRKGPKTTTEPITPRAEPTTACVKRTHSLLDLPPDLITDIAHRLAKTECDAARRTVTVSTVLVVRRASTWNRQAEVRDLLALGMTCRGLQDVRNRVLAEQRDLQRQVHESSHLHEEKTKLVRKLSLTHHAPLTQGEVAVEVLGGLALVCGWLAVCSQHPTCSFLNMPLQSAAVAVLHLCAHSLVLACAYKCCARLGLARTLLLGAVPTAALCCALALFDTGRVLWRPLSVAMFSVTWVYGAWEYRAAHGYLKLCNGLKS